MKRILIVDDHDIVRKGLRQILLDEGVGWVVEEAANCDEVLPRLLSPPALDAVILDVSMPGRGGLHLLKDLQIFYPQLPVLVLTVFSEEEYAVRAFRLGAMGFLTKGAAAEDLAQAVRTIVAGRRFVTPTVAERLVQYLGAPAGGPLHACLSNREFQVLGRIASGKTVTEIAGEMALSVKTVSTYRCRVLKKLRLQTNAEITRYCIANSLML